jgi:NADPH-dependent F420 reductase
MKLGILGGTGIEGRGLALRLASAGAAVVVGSRSADRAGTVAAEYNAVLSKPLIEGRSNVELLAVAELVFLTVPFDTALAALDSCRSAFRPGHILVDVTVPIVFKEGRPQLVQPEGGSNSELIARHAPPGIAVAAAFKTIPAHVLADLETELRCDVFVCSDSSEARERVMGIASMVPTLRPIDAGPLASAAILERMTFLAIQLNRRYKRKGARFAIQGI